MKPAVYNWINVRVSGRCNTRLKVVLFKAGWPWQAMTITDRSGEMLRVRWMSPLYVVQGILNRRIDTFLFNWSPTQRCRLARELARGMGGHRIPNHQSVNVVWYRRVGLFMLDR